MPAITLADAVVNIGTNLEPLQKGLGKAQQGLKSFAGGATRLLGGAIAGGAAVAAGAILGIGTAALSVSNETHKLALRLQGDLGVTEEKARDLAETARDVFSNNFADSVADAGLAVALVQQQLGDLANAGDIQRISENAFRLRDAFGVDIEESISSVRTLMDQFGISSDRAFDMIAAGFQRGLNRSDDFLDTINEYSVQFAEGGANADEFFQILDNGLQGGVLGTDKAADAFKEFRVRIADGSDTTADALEMIGINADELTERLANGSLTTIEAFREVSGAIEALEDPVAQMQAGVGLIGTQFEDLGSEIVLNLSKWNDWGEGVDGTIRDVDRRYNDLQSVAQSVWRKIIDAATPFTDELIKIANEAMPAVTNFIDTELGPIFEGWAIEARDLLTGENGLIAAIEEAGKSGHWQPLLEQIAGADSALAFVVAKVIEFLELIRSIPAWMDENVFDPMLRVENKVRDFLGMRQIADPFIRPEQLEGISGEPQVTVFPQANRVEGTVDAFPWQNTEINVNVNVVGADPGNGANIGARAGIERGFATMGITP